MPRVQVKPSRTAGLGTRIQEEIHQAAKVYSAETNKSLAELIEAGLQQQLSLGVIKLNLGFIRERLRERAQFVNATEYEIDRAVARVLEFANPDDPNETVQDLLEEYGVWSKLHDQVTAEITAICSNFLSKENFELVKGKGKFDLVSDKLSDKLGEFRVNRLYPLLNMAVADVVEG